MNKAFIFDMDGVIIADESKKKEALNEVWPELVGSQIASVFRIPVGQTPLSIYSEAVKHGATISEEQFMSEFEKVALRIYNESPITSDMDKLGEYLLSKEYKIGVVSSAKKEWMEIVLKRLAFGDKISAVVSINDHRELKPKPHPGGYLEAIAELGAISDTTIILEDSNSGIQAAKSAGAYTIGLTSNLLPEYTQHGADIYANNVAEVIAIVEKFPEKFSPDAHVV